MLKASRYNFWATYHDDDNSPVYLLFNGRSGALYELNESERTQAIDCLATTNEMILNPEMLKNLIAGGFLIPTEVDEVELLAEAAEKTCTDSSVLDITISPTYACNFRCSYCYVDFQQGSMSRDVEKSILLYLEKNLPKFHRLNLSWFGGEPLLCLETVLRLSCEIATLADRFGTRADFFITSNGYLLDPVTVKKLIMAGIRFFHVTVDGDAAYHDRFRVLADGSPSHAIIMMNILALLKNSPEAHLTLRMNADEENLSSFGAVLEMIPQAERGRVQVNIMPIIRNGETPSSSLFASINETLRDAQRMGYQYYDQRVPVGRGCFCNAEKLENFQIGPDGRLHKCSPSGKPEVQVGILDSEGTAIFNERFARWHSLPVIENQCRDCPYLCFCMGGCRLDRARGIHRASCKNRYLDINNIVINRYLALQNHDPFWQY